MANASAEQSFGLLRSLLSGGPNESKAQAIVAIDGCCDARQVLKAYGADGAAHREFLMNGLVHANRVLGREDFRKEDWQLATTFDISNGILKQDYIARRYLAIPIGAERITIQPGENVNICQSGKWSSEKVSSLAKVVGIHVRDQWQHDGADYGMYLLCKDYDGISASL